MTLHIFNPEHDIALAYDNKYFTAPHAGRQMRHDLDYLPVLWAKDGDYILVENVNSARIHARRFMSYGQQVHFIDSDNIEQIIDEVKEVMPWGWDSAIKFQLKQLGIKANVLPTDENLSAIRELSNREYASHVLRELRELLDEDILIGESFCARNVAELTSLLKKIDKAVIKAPWSSSGRGVRYIDTMIDPAILNWANNVIKQQGNIMVEPYYNKVKDFGMEFIVDKDGVHYVGLSVFHTMNGAYIGNSLEKEEVKQELLSTYIAVPVLNNIAQTLETLLSKQLTGIYYGALGVDMMIVANGSREDVGFKLHPLVEINLRRTMGHVALSLSNKKSFQHKMMRIDNDGSHYHLHILNNVSSTNSEQCQLCINGPLYIDARLLWKQAIGSNCS